MTLRACLEAGRLPVATAVALRRRRRARPCGRPRARNRPPRHQAGKPVRHLRGHRQDSRLRAGQADAPGGRQSVVSRDDPRRHAPQRRPGHVGVYGAGAGERAGGRSPGRYFLVWLRAVRDAGRTAGVRPRHACRHDQRRVERSDAGHYCRARTSGPAPLRQILRRCLEKNPVTRFQSASDLAFALSDFGRGATEVSRDAPETVAVSPKPPRAIARVAIAAAALAGALGAGAWIGQR